MCRFVTTVVQRYISIDLYRCYRDLQFLDFFDSLLLINTVNTDPPSMGFSVWGWPWADYPGNDAEGFNQTTYLSVRIRASLIGSADVVVSNNYILVLKFFLQKNSNIGQIWLGPIFSLMHKPNLS